MQRIQAFRACLRLPMQSPQQEACFAASRDATPSAKPLDCRRYDERRIAFSRAYRKARNICFALYPDTTPTQMEEFSACMNDRMGW